MLSKFESYIHPTTIVDEGCEIGEKTKIWCFTHIIKSSKIGKNCTIGQNVCIGPNVMIGNRVRIQNNVFIPEGVTIEDDVFLGPSCVFTNVLKPEQGKVGVIDTTLVEEFAVIGANATIICGITIGECAFVGAGSVVTKNVKGYTLVYGNPARFKKWLWLA